MLKKLGITTIALAGMLAFAAPKKADARVCFGVYVGGPAYSYPVAPAPVAPYAYAPNYAYVAPAPAYVEPYYAAPSYRFGFGFGGDRDHDHDYGRHESHERAEHSFRGGERGGRR